MEFDVDADSGAGWFEGAGPEEFDRTVDVYYGPQGSHDLLERTDLGGVAGADCMVKGGELFEEESHGNGGMYMSGG